MNTSAVDAGYKQILLVVWLSMLGIAAANLQPLIVGGYVSQLRLSDEQSGIVVFAAGLGSATGLLLFLTYFYRWGFRRIVIFALTVTCIGNLLSMIAGVPASLIPVRFTAALGEGLLLATVMALATRFPHPDRVFAFIMIGMSVSGALTLAILPEWIDLYGIRLVFLGIAMTAVASMLLYRMLPAASAGRDTDIRGLSLVIDQTAVWLCASLLILYIAMGGIWTYYERIGDSLGFSPGGVGTALASGMIASMLGAVAAALLRERRGRIGPILVGGGLVVLGAYCLLVAGEFSPYVLSIVLIYGGSGFSVPYFLGAFAHRDASGRLVALGQLTITVASMLAPAWAASLVDSGDYQNLKIGGTALLILSLLFAIASQLAVRRSHQDSPETGG